MGKTKNLNDTRDSETEENGVVEEYDVSEISPIARPLLPQKSHKKIMKLIRKAYAKKMIKMGVKNVQKSIRKKEKGLVLLAGNTSPIDTISHFPVHLEDEGYSYCFVPSEKMFEQAMGSEHGPAVMLVQNSSDYDSLFNKLKDKVDSLPRFGSN